ncbi:MAG: hypothetical protein KDC24_03590 [Saprospiraceae bacterium]|nr:hypothetical protein [Saprospiraceae bacterium]
MYNYGLFVFLFFLLVGCADESEKNTKIDFTTLSPEEVSKAWQRAIDVNDFSTAKALSTDKTKEFVASIEKLIGDDPALETVDTTIFVSMECETIDSDAKCIYRFRIEGDIVTDSFFLKRENNQWLIDIQEEVFLDDGETEELINELNNSEDNFFE